MVIPSAAPDALRIEGLSKSFGAVQALVDVSLQVGVGTIHALLGRNGSGKSTLIKVLSGYHHPDAGDVWIGGERLNDAPLARERIGFVHQDLGVLPRLSILENLVIGRPYPTRWGRIDEGRLRTAAHQVLEPFGLASRIDEPLGTLSKGQAAMVAIARALYSQEHLRLLVLDEPTSALPVAERAHLFRTMRALAARGIGVLFVTHHLHEAVSIADSATVLRDGRVAARERGPTMDEATLIGDMVGTLPAIPASAPKKGGGIVSMPSLRLERVDGQVLRGVDLMVRRGEVVAAVGLVGSGLEELALVASGRVAPLRGLAQLDTPAGTVSLVAAAQRGSVGLVPSERLTQAIFATLSIRENVTISRPDEYLTNGRISRRAETVSVRMWARRLGIVPADPEVPVGRLSGGNQQKVVMARWLHIEPELLVAAEPTQGVDLVAKRDLLDALRRAAASFPVLIVSHEPEEVIGICDRIVVLRDGAILTEVDRADARLDTLLEAFA